MTGFSGMSGYGAAAQVLGSILQGVAAKQAQDEMEKAFREELNRQRGFRNEGFGVLQGHFPSLGVETAREQMAEGQAHREGAYNEAQGRDFAVNQPRGFGTTNRDNEYLKLAGNARAKLGAYSDWQLDQLVDRIRTQDELNRIVNFSGGEAGVFPYRMYDAQHSWDDLSFVGGLLSSLGGGASSLGNLYAAPPINQPRSSQLFDIPAGSFSEFGSIV